MPPDDREPFGADTCCDCGEAVRGGGLCGECADARNEHLALDDALDELAGAQTALDDVYARNPVVDEDERDPYLCRARPLEFKQAISVAHRRLETAQRTVTRIAIERRTKGAARKRVATASAGATSTTDARIASLEKRVTRLEARRHAP